MTATPLPATLQLAAGVLTFSIAGFLVAAHAILHTLAARAVPGRAAARAPWLVAGYLAVWLALALVVSDAANFAQPRPLLRLLVSAIVGFGPMLLALALLFRSRTLRALNAAMDPASLIRLQSYRMAGLMFLFPFLAYGILPAGFAWPAAVGDFLTGLAAPFVAAAVARRRPGALAWATAWNAFGILDLIVAPIAAVLSSAAVFDHHPLALVPLFLGPPLGMLTHACSLRNLAAAYRGQASRSGLTPAAAAAS